jgi:hypothetical protein
VDEVKQDRVYWGVMLPGQPLPESLWPSRKLARVYLSCLSREQRRAVQIVRAYVTVEAAPQPRISRRPRELPTRRRPALPSAPRRDRRHA